MFILCCYTCNSMAYHENIFNTHQTSLDISTLSTLITIIILFTGYVIKIWHCSHLRSCVLQAAPVFVVIIPAVRGPRLALTGIFLLYIRVILVTSQLALVYTLYTDQYLFFFRHRRNYYWYLRLGFSQSNSIVFYQMYTYKYIYPVCNRLTKESKLIYCTENKFHFWPKMWEYMHERQENLHGPILILCIYIQTPVLVLSIYCL